MNIRPLITEKAVMNIEAQNTFTFVVDKNAKKDEIKNELEKVFGIKIEKVRTQVRDNRKYVYAKLKKEFVAMDLATKLGVI